jgi:periplasmic copper chaperone A
MTGRRTALAAAIAAAVLGAGGLLAGCGSPGAEGGARSTAARSEAAALTPSPAPAPARISVTGSYIPMPAAPGMAAGYLTVHNTGEAPDRLLKVTGPDPVQVSLHRSTPDGSMEPLASPAVPAHGVLLFARGGNHLMIMGLGPDLAVGDTVELKLAFARSGTVTVRVPVKPRTYRPPAADPSPTTATATTTAGS